MSIGYACQIIGQPDMQISSCRLQNASPERLWEITAANLAALERMTAYNITRGIRLFRISSDIIPFATHPVNTLPWRELFAPALERIGSRIKASGMRVSMHPGQYTVLNSPREGVAQEAMKDLAYHGGFLDALGLDSTHKVIVHIGGVYGDKPRAMKLFAQRFAACPAFVKKRLAAENDERSFTVADVLALAGKCGIPAVMDILHHRLYPPQMPEEEARWLTLCGHTWGREDGIQKIHYSQSRPGGPRGAHSETIKAEEFLDFYKDLPDRDIDIMLEVKDKNLSAIKCGQLLKQGLPAKELEDTWAQYKYLILSKSAPHYNALRELLKDKQHVQALSFYRLVEQAMALPEDRGAQLHAGQHIWGYLNKQASPSQKKRFAGLSQDYAAGKTGVAALKSFLYRCAGEQAAEYLLRSYYFYIS